MRLSIETDEGIIFRLEDESALVPSAEDERFTVLEALTQALSIISGAKDAEHVSTATISPKRDYGYGTVIPFRRS